MKAYILSRGGSAEEAGDIFQEAIIDLYKLSLDGKFILTCPFEAFLLLLCKRKWFSQQKKNSKNRVTSIDDGVYTDIGDDNFLAAEQQVTEIQKENLVMEMLHTISEKCKEIILVCLQKKAQEELAEQLGMTYGYFRKRKSNCMGELAELVKDHPNYSIFNHGN